MTQKIHISIKLNDDSIVGVGGDNYDEFSQNLALLGLDVDAVVARYSHLLGMGPAPTDVRQATGPGTTHVQSGPPRGNSGPPQRQQSGPPQRGGGQKSGRDYADRHYIDVDFKDSDLRKWVKDLGASWDAAEKSWYVSERFVDPQSDEYQQLSQHFGF